MAGESRIDKSLSEGIKQPEGQFNLNQVTQSGHLTVKSNTEVSQSVKDGYSNKIGGN
jgi:hypothetical protein